MIAAKIRSNGDLWASLGELWGSLFLQPVQVQTSTWYFHGAALHSPRVVVVICCCMNENCYIDDTCSCPELSCLDIERSALETCSWANTNEIFLKSSARNLIWLHLVSSLTISGTDLLFFPFSSTDTENKKQLSTETVVTVHIRPPIDLDV